MTLQELTHHEAGIILYGNHAIVDNWSSYGDDQIPKLFYTGCVGFPVADGAIEAMEKTSRRVEHILDAMPDSDDVVIESDHNNDIPRIYNGEDDEPGTVYDLPDGGLLIVPDDWA